MSEAVPELLVVDYEQVKSDEDLSKVVEAAYGPGAFGVLAIRNIPGFVEAKLAVLKQAHKLAHLPKEKLEALEDEKSLYNVGWSHGREKLGDKPDFAKGSFYFNPLKDSPGTPEEREKYPLSYPENIWPSEDMPELEPAAKHLGKLMHEVCFNVARHIDNFAKSKIPNYVPGLGDALKNTEKAKGRLLYYFPLSEDQQKENSADSWIGWHNDSGYLTCLAGDIYVNDDTGEVIPCPDPSAGLYIVDRNGNDVHVKIPEDCMAVQLGECVQIITGGAVQATPHCVRGATPPPGSNIRVARVSHPVFIDTAPYVPLRVPEGVAREHVIERDVSPKVPPLHDRFTENGMEFGEFLKKTFEKYYEFNKA